MESDGVSEEVAAGKTVTIGGIVFDNTRYDEQGDVLYVQVGDPRDAVDYDGTAEGDGTRYGPDGSLIGITILNAKLRLERDGGIQLTLPEHTVTATDLGDVFDHPWEYVPDRVKIPGVVTLGSIEFDDVQYDRSIDALFLRSGPPDRVVSEGGSEEFHPFGLDADGEVVAVTIADARRTLEEEGKIVITLPDGRRLELSGLGPALAAA